jgi:ligand-binding SRPBCC domain-containing protein
MKLHTFHKIQRLAISPGQAWRFFSDPRNLCEITPDWLAFKMTCPVDDAMYPGQILTYTIQPVPGVRLNWTTEITHVQEPVYFVDEQRFGPYRFWHHQHHFQKSGRSVEVTDLVHYALPLGPLGEAVHALLIRARLKDIFDYREEALRRRFS